MKHSSTSSIISSLMLAGLTLPTDAGRLGDELSPSNETICALQLFARTFKADVCDLF